MFEKFKSFFKKKKEPEEDSCRQEDFENLQKTTGDLLYPILVKFFRYQKNSPEGISDSDWAKIKERILWSFSALKEEKGHINKMKNEKYKEKIRSGLILFGRHIDNFKL